MPIRQGEDSEGHFYRWGQQTKYYFDPDDEEERKEAREKAKEQMKAAYAAGYVEK